MGVQLRKSLCIIIVASFPGLTFFAHKSQERHSEAAKKEMGVQLRKVSLVPRPYFFLLINHKKDIVRQQRKKWAYS